MMLHEQPINCIIPPHMMQHMLENRNRGRREIALRTLMASMHLQTQRSVMGSLAGAPPAGTKRRTIYDAEHQEITGGQLVRGEDGPKSKDTSVNSAYDYLGVVYDYFSQVHQRNSIDDNGMRLDGVIHYGEEFNNAFWNGQRMVFGDGDGIQFTDFTKSLDVIAHELAHGVTEYTAGLVYNIQPGALNESFSDVFGCLVKQWHLDEDAASADWLIGAEIYSPGISGDALRSLKAPGTAYDDPNLGKDPQPAHMDDFVVLPNTRFGDWGGVHINSGIPNHAFYLVATTLGGSAWEEAGVIWYDTLKRLGPNSQFIDCANTSISVASELYGASSHQVQAVKGAWDDVGVTVGTTMASSKRGRNGASAAKRNGQGDSMTSLKKELQTMSQLLQQVLAEI